MAAQGEQLNFVACTNAMLNKRPLPGAVDELDIAALEATIDEELAEAAAAEAALARAAASNAAPAEDAAAMPPADVADETAAREDADLTDYQYTAQVMYSDL